MSPHKVRTIIVAIIFLLLAWFVGTQLGGIWLWIILSACLGLVVFKILNTENFEVLLIALLMAIIVRCFIFEIYKIPTGSMEPTLLGDHPCKWSGDRVLVNKFAYRLAPIHRFDVIVFHYPLQKTKNFIKRVVGLPNEELTLFDGDLYTRRRGEQAFHIARKPLSVQNSVWIPVDPEKPDDSGLSLWSFNPPTSNNFTPKISLPLSVDARQQSATLRLTQFPLDLYYRDFSGACGTSTCSETLKTCYVDNPAGGRGGLHTVPDIKFDFAFSVQDSRASLQVDYSVRGFSFSLTLSPQAAAALLYHPPPSFPSSPLPKNLMPASIQPFPLEKPASGYRFVLPSFSQISSGQIHHVTFMHFDGTLHILLDHSLLIHFPYLPPLQNFSRLPSPATTPPSLTLSVQRTQFTLHSLALHRDIYYLRDPDSIFSQKAFVFIPPHDYFVMGDHTTSSYDSRLWKTDMVQVKGGPSLSVDNSPQNSELLEIEEGNRCSRSEWDPRDSQMRKVYYPCPDPCFIHASEGVCFRDQYGIYHAFAKDQLKNPQYLEDTSLYDHYQLFVPEDQIIGKASMVLYPWSPKFRLKFIH